MVPAKEAACQQRCVPQIRAQTAYSHVRNLLVDDGVMACLGLDVAFGVLRTLGLPVGLSMGNPGLGRRTIQTSRTPTAHAHPRPQELVPTNRMGNEHDPTLQSQVVGQGG